MRQPVRWILALALALSASVLAFGQTPAKEIPPSPTKYFTDQAGIVDPAVGEKINQQLEQFEKDTSNQVLVVIYNKLPEDAEIAQFAVDTFHTWGVGQKGKDNGAILFVFAQDHKIQITTGRGLEGALPDATCSMIVRHEIVPAFKQGDFSGGIQAGVNAIIAATKGEYKGDGSTDADNSGSGQDNSLPPWAALLIILIFIIIIFVLPRGGGGGPMIFYGGGGGFSGGFGDSGGFGGGDSGGFSGGGGDSAGGGAGGSW